MLTMSHPALPEPAALGLTPSRPAGSTVRHAVLDTAIGALTVVVDEVGVTGLYFPRHWTRPDPNQWGPRVDPSADAVLDQARTELAEYLTGTRLTFTLPLRLTGSATATRLWARLQAIPYGSTTTYGALAAELGGIGARAVGRLVGANPVSIVVPCHRVVGAAGALTGYAGGLHRKQHLLELEGARPPVAAALW
jgi:methylated-DNA-[protein]-cysteine S-methyltransferase